MTVSFRPLAAAAFSFALLSATASAQSLLYPRNGDKVNDRLGIWVRSIGDTNADGRPDFLAGAPEDGAVFGAGEGFARLYSGANGATLRTFDGVSIQDQFGTSVDGIGDINLDGAADIAIGAPQFSGLGSNRGRVYVYSGANGAPIFTFDGAVNGEKLGMIVVGVGDVNMDGRPDILAGSREAAAGGTQRGIVRIYSGLNGSVLHTLQGATNNERLGLSADGIGDVNGDGRADFVISSLTAGVRVYSGSTGAVLYPLLAPSADDLFGASVAGIGDVTGDGVPDFLVGATQDANIFNLGTGYVRVYSGVNGALVRTLTGSTIGDRFGIATADARDVNGDGRPEILVGADQQTSGLKGYARLFDGGSGTLLHTFLGIADGDRFGASVDGLGDVDGVGQPEVIIGAPNHAAAFSAQGRAEIWTVPVPGCPLPYTYCAVANNSTGGPALISSSGTTGIAANDFSLSCMGLPPNTLGLFYYGQTEIQNPFGNGFRCVGGTAFRLGVQSASAGGIATRAINYGALPPGGAILAGSTWKFQFWYRNPAGGGAGFNLSNALSATFCN